MISQDMKELWEKATGREWNDGDLLTEEESAALLAACEEYVREHGILGEESDAEETTFDT